MRMLALLAILSCAGGASAEMEWLDRLDRALSVQSPGGFFRADLSGLLDLEGYYVDQRPPGLIFGGDASFLAPRLSLFLDTRLGRHLYGVVQARFDRGFDPSERRGDARLDEYLLRYTPFDGPALNLQLGKFATVVGNWVLRHHSWDNPFINAPLPYENVTIVSDAKATDDPAGFLARRNLPDRKREWVPIIWGPNYASGGAVFGHVSRIDWAAEVKNAALASRPEAWDPRTSGWERPTASGRLGWRPSAAWVFGVSASSGPYLREKARRTLASDQDLGDFRETVLAADGSWAWRHVQLWAEFFAARFDVPIACRTACRGSAEEDADTAAYYVEGRYKITPELFGAVRWNQQFFGDVPDGRGRERSWDRDAWRADLAVGWRFQRHLQAKLQYDVGRQAGRLQQGEQLVALQLTLKF